MNKDSVLSLKKRVMDDLEEESSGLVTRMQTLVNPRIESRLAVGYSEKSAGDYQLELRVQSDSGKAYKRADEIKQEAANDVNIEVVPSIEIPPLKTILEQTKVKTKFAASKRPLHIGLSIGHADGGAGTLGAFVSDDENVYILSNNHVLGLLGGAKDRDPIYQPGRPDQWPIRTRSTIAELSDVLVISKVARNLVDSAIAILVVGIDHVANTIPRKFGFPREGESINKPPPADKLPDLLRKGERVCKIGRTTGLTEGYISAISLDNVPVKTPSWNAVFDNVIEITWDSEKKPFSLPGDSGSLVFTKDGLVAIGLHFAGGKKVVNGEKVGVSYSCSLPEVLKAHEVSFLA